MGWRGASFEVKTPEQLAAMRPAGLLVGETLELLRGEVAAGMTTADLDALAEEHIRAGGGTPSFLGYQGFPASICVSVNDEVVHGIPGSRVLAEGDLVSIDCGAIVDGWHGDAAISLSLGPPTPEVAELLRVTEDALWAGIAAVADGRRVAAVSAAVEDTVRAGGRFGVVEEYTGHGIGTEMHLDPDVPNVVRRGRSPRLVTGMAIAIEPMVTLGRPQTDVLPDEWTVVTSDGSLAAHFEHTVALTADGPWVTTALDGGIERLAALGATCGAR